MIVADHILPVLPMDEHTPRLQCVEILMDNMCFELPILREGKLYGTVQLDECIHSQEETIESLVDAGYASIHRNSHIIDALHVLKESKANVCCVLGDEYEWQGVLTKTGVLQALSDSVTITQGGSTLLVEMAPHHYSSSEISRIIEGEGAQLLGLWLTNVAESGRIRASLKLNTLNAERIINGLQRYGYEVIAAFGDDDYKENVERRFQSFMKYIDV
ncbi:MAG: hypothetical protein ABF321_09645 [Bacteroidia bacterium]|nr:hypothetical protein [Bacteroidia bacterium]